MRWFSTQKRLQKGASFGRLATFTNLLFRSLWEQDMPEDFIFEFRPLWQPSETDKATIATADAQSVSALFSAGIFDKKQALTELRNSGRASGRFMSITDEDIINAEKEDQAPSIPPNLLPEAGA